MDTYTIPTTQTHLQELYARRNRYLDALVVANDAMLTVDSAIRTATVRRDWGLVGALGHPRKHTRNKQAAAMSRLARVEYDLSLRDYNFHRLYERKDH